MGKKVYTKTALTGGGDTALDGIDGNLLNNGDIGIVTAAGVIYFYVLNNDLATAESSPGIISPDKNYGTKRWVLQNLITGSLWTGVLQLPSTGYIQFADQGEIRSKDTNHRITFDRANNTLYIREYGKIYLQTGVGPTNTAYFDGGAVYNYANSAHWDVASDDNTKKNVVDYELGLKELIQLQPKRFEFNGALGTEDGKKGLGLIAQDVEKVLPEAVVRPMDESGEIQKDKPLGLSGQSGDHLHMMMINAVKELSNTVKDLTLRLEKLEKI